MEEESSSAIALAPELAAPRFGLLGFGASDLGTRHEHNEDRFAVQRAGPSGAILVVCDGMGGMGRGDQASTFALTRLVEVLGRSQDAPLEAATSAIRQIDRDLVAALGADPASGRFPGTTCAVVQVDKGVAQVSWVGDSSVLLIRNGRLARSTRPHRVVQDLIESGAMTAAEARTSPMARFLARSLGGRAPDDRPVEPDHLKPWHLLPGDTILVCSDGLTDTLTAEEIVAVVSRGDPVEDTVRALIAASLERGVDDNITVAMARCVHESSAPEEEFLTLPWDLLPEPPEEEPDDEADLRGRPAAAEPTLAIAAPSRSAWLVVWAGLSLAAVGLVAIGLALLLLFL